MIKCVRDVIDTSIKDGITLDTIKPTAAVSYSLNRSVKSGETLRITATFNESMIDSPKPKVAISGSNTISATDMVKTDATHYTIIVLAQAMETLRLL
jgi:hypothetical protein